MEPMTLLLQLRLAPWDFAAQFIAVGLLVAVLIPWTARFAWRRRGGLQEGALIAAAACMLLGLALRVMVDPFPADIRSALDMGFMIGRCFRWAAAYSVVQHALFSVFPPVLETVSRANILFDTVSIGLLYAVARRLLRDPAAAVAAAAVYAAHPIAARFAASDSAHVLLTLCYLISLWLLVLWREEGEPRALLAAAAWWAVACNVRMEAVIFAPAAALIAATIRSDKPLRWREPAAACLAAAPFLVFPAVDILTDLAADHGSSNLEGFIFNPFFDPSVSPLPVIAAALLGAAAALRRRPWKLAAALAAAAFIALPTMEPSADNQTNYRYFLPVLALFAVAAGHGAAAAADGLGARRPLRLRTLFVLIALIAAGSAPWWGFLRRAWTHELEFTFARRHLRGIADDCTVVRLARFGAEAGLEISPKLSLEVGRRHLWRDTEHFLEAPSLDGCVVYYESASCRARAGTGVIRDSDWTLRPECRRMRRLFVLEPIAEGRLRAAPFGAEAYMEDPVRVGYYRIVGARPPSTGSGLREAQREL